MMDVIIERLNLKYDWRFHMFGDLASEDKLREESKKEMTIGILPAAIQFNAMYDRSIIEDIAWSDAIVNSKLMMRRIPLTTSYTLSGDSGLPPIGQTPQTPEQDEGGRPPIEDATSEGGEQDQDSYGETRFE